MDKKKQTQCHLYPRGRSEKWCLSQLKKMGADAERWCGDCEFFKQMEVEK